MKVQVSFTTKTILILLAMVLTVAIVISAVLIQESDARVLLQQREGQIANHRRVQLFEDILHGRMVTLIDLISRKNDAYTTSVDELQQSLSDLNEYLTLTYQVESLLLFDESGVVGSPGRAVDTKIKNLVDTTRATFESRSLLTCDNVCTHHISIPVMADSDVIPIVVVSTSMRELLYLFSRATDVHKVAIVQARETQNKSVVLTIASQVSAANRQYLQSLFNALPPAWRIDDLVIKGLNTELENKQLLVSLLPFEHATGDRPYLLIVQDVSATVRQNEQYQYVVISSATALFLVFSSLLYLFLNQYRTRLLGISERLPMLAEHKFSEFYTSVAKRRTSPIFKLTDELDVVEEAANDLARQLESFDGQMAINTAKLEKMAMFDVLTGLPNRNMLTFQIEKQLAGSIRDERLVALMFMDLDDFKKVNDQYGHDEGDAVLKKIAELMSDSIGSSGVVARWGGEEFALLFSGSFEENFEDKIRAMQARIESYDFKLPRNITVSVGAGIFHPDNHKSSLLTIDSALYEAKSSGKNCLKVSYD